MSEPRGKKSRPTCTSVAQQYNIIYIAEAHSRIDVESPLMAEHPCYPGCVCVCGITTLDGSASTS
eukprot:365990-Chlamydomonas_euryale.AAC.18